MINMDVVEKYNEAKKLHSNVQLKYFVSVLRNGENSEIAVNLLNELNTIKISFDELTKSVLIIVNRGISLKDFPNG